MKKPNFNRRWFRIPLKILMWIVAGVIFLIILAIVVFQIPAVQNYAAGKAVTFLKDKLDTKVELESIRIGFPKTVNIKGLFIADRNNDTLLYAGAVNVGLNMTALLKNKLLIRSVEFKNVTGKVYRQFPDTSFNYTFIIDAFTGDTTSKVSNDTTGSMIINLNKIRLENIRVLYSDTLSGIKTAAFIGEFNTRFTDFDLNKLVFKVDDIKLNNSTFSLLQTPSLIHSTDTSTSVPPIIGFNTLALQNITFSMLNPKDGNTLKTIIGNLDVKADLIDIQKQKFALQSVKLDKSNVQFEHTKPQHFDTIVEKVLRKEGMEKLVATPQWEFKVKELIIDDNRLAYENDDSIAAKKGMDFNHISVTAFNLKTKDLYATPGKITLAMEHMSLNEKSGFSLEEFSSKINYDTTNITLANLLIKTPNSTIQDHLEINFKSISELTGKPEKAVVNIALNNSVIAARDILYFVPTLTDIKNVKIRETDLISLSGKITGSMEDMSFQEFNLRNNGSTQLAFSGRVKNMMDPDNLYAELKALSVSTSRSDINRYVDEKMIPESITLPGELSLKGSFTGFLQNFNAKAKVNSSFGNMSASVFMNPSLGNRLTNYKAELEIDRFDLGKLLNKSDTLGPVSLQASANGIGFKPDSMNAEVKAVISEAFYSGYTYKNLTAEGFLVNRSYHGEVFIKDNNIDFNYTGYVNLNPDSLAMIFDLQLNGADLKALKLSKDDLKVTGYIHSDLAKRYGPNPLGKLKIYDVKVVRNGFTCPFDSLIVESFYDYDSSVVNVRSQFLNATFRGDLVVHTLPETLLNHLNQYFAFQDTIAESKEEPSAENAPQNFRFNITMDDPNYICDNLIPELKKYIPLTINGKYNSKDMALVVKLELPMLDYKGTRVDSLRAEINSDSQKLNYKFKIGEISNQNFMLQQFAMNGDISDNKIKYNISAQKTDTFNVLHTSGLFAIDGSQYKLIMDEPFILNNTAWQLDPDNVITFTDKGINAQKVILTGQDQMVSIITQPGDNIPLKVTFKNFELMNASIIIEKDEELARGELNGHFILFKVNGVSAFTSDLKIDSLKFRSIPIGNIELLADNSKDPTRFDVSMKLSGYGNQMAITGNYQARDSVGLLDLRANIPHLNMSTVQPFTFGQLSRMEGFLNADISIKGTTDAPDPQGYLKLNGVAFRTLYANTFLKVSDNQLNIANKRLNIQQLTLTDTLNNTAKITGYADFSDLLSPQFNIRVNTDNFLAMNVVNRNKDLPVYGTVLLDSDIRLRGSISSPVIDMSVKLNNGTKVTYVLPEEEMLLNEGEGVVVFTDSLGLKSNILSNDPNQPYVSTTQGISLDASIVFEPQAVLKILVDPVAGDSLFVTGDGTLNFSMEPGGQMNLTGTYDINSGGYNLTLNNLIKREFTISEGSTITWTGDIMDALIDLTAVYKVETSPMVLLQDQVEGMEEAARNTYKNELTFLVNLKMKGKLTKPEISFDILQPDEEKGALNGTVNARLNELRTDESQLNKQVFSLLTLNRFMGQDPFETGGAPLTVESATRSSASKLLTQQFSALSEKYIKGVDLDVGVRSFEDYSTGQQQGRTQLKLGVRKELLNDRLMVQVGGNVELEGAQTRKNDVSNIAGNINVEYKLTPLGRYRLRGFRRIEYENPIEGEIINTGVGISYTRDFIGLKQLFTSEKKRQEKIRAREAKLLEEERKAEAEGVEQPDKKQEGQK